ncbi:MarR family winged helix-turn-helix transcriptional regulator [Streptomyces sp. NPDC006798]|uniref:MarR family winged helix-turn-helix transcriptional regulator n=1 Tax=Streptomyces sp. NPDC006798 TaxID=3155462 RepID=UPI0033CBA679
MTDSRDDAELLRQPIGYWTWAAGKTVLAYARARLAAIGVTQPQWWVLNHVVGSGDGATRDELLAANQDNLDVGAGLAPEIDVLLERKLLVRGDDDRLRITEEGRELRDRAAGIQRANREKVCEGITEEEYLTTVRVLRRMTRNVGADVSDV